MTCKEQLDLWVEGESKHNAERDECCPELLAPKEVREVFAAAFLSDNEKVTYRMLMEFLGRAIATLMAEPA